MFKRGNIAWELAPFSTIDEVILENKKYIVEKRVSDDIMFEALQITFVSKEDIDVFLEKIKKHNIYVKIYSKNAMLQCLSFNFLVELNPPYIDGTSITVSLADFKNRYSMLHSFNDEIVVCFDDENLIENIVESKIYNNYIYSLNRLTVNITNELQMVTGGKVKLDLLKNIVHNGETFVYEFLILTNAEASAFYILTPNIDKLVSFEIKIAQASLLKYDKFCINRYCKRISNKLLFIPSSAVFGENDIIDFGKIRNLTVALTFTEKPDSLDFYIKNMAILNYYGYKGYSAFSLSYNNYIVDEKFKNLVLTIKPNLKTLNFLLIFEYKEGETEDNILTTELELLNIPKFYCSLPHDVISTWVGYWRFFGSMFIDLPIENSATENQDDYIEQLKLLEQSNLAGSQKKRRIKCHFCDCRFDTIGYEYNDLNCVLRWPSHYTHYLKEHNVKIDERMIHLLKLTKPKLTKSEKSCWFTNFFGNNKEKKNDNQTNENTIQLSDINK